MNENQIENTAAAEDKSVLDIIDEELSQKKADCNNISRYKMREQTFLLLFESLFSDTDIDEIADNIIDSRSEFLCDYAIKTVKLIKELQAEIDAVVSAHLSDGWKLTRISRVSLALLELAVYEMKYNDEIPVSVSINEAVELAKRYTSADDASFINGVLGSISRETA